MNEANVSAIGPLDADVTIERTQGQAAHALNRPTFGMSEHADSGRSGKPSTELVRAE
jgi:hypothetical protein